MALIFTLCISTMALFRAVRDRHKAGANDERGVGGAGQMTRAEKKTKLGGKEGSLTLNTTVEFSSGVLW
jgi:hypothetical protein